jgi:hypothetical protein
MIGIPIVNSEALTFSASERQQLTATNDAWASSHEPVSLLKRRGVTPARNDRNAYPFLVTV